MIILLHGPDTYRSRQKLQEIVERYRKVHKSGLSLTYYDALSDSFEKFFDEFRQFTMFKEKKLVVLQNVFQSESFKEKFLRSQKSFFKTDNIIVIFEQGKVLKGDRLFKQLSKEAKTQEFSILQGTPLRNWVKKEFEKYSARPEPQAVEKLIEFVGFDSWRIASEVKKLAAFNKSVDERTVELLVSQKIDTDIFKTIDAIGAKNKKQAIALLKKHLLSGDPPLYLLSMINYQFRNLLLVKSGSKHPNMHPFVARKSAEQARRFSFEELKRIYRKLLETDLNIKTGKLDAETALDLLVAEL
ncbi:MAG: hypothetical protein G01um101430_112 [Parcubacteria group bacterium Gr01-1014_30]|nr:MAG: hypothetical protein G01um101430_112 [Parcubacteria group bacterium Gr01-1014_30]